MGSKPEALAVDRSDHDARPVSLWNIAAAAPQNDADARTAGLAGAEGLPVHTGEPRPSFEQVYDSHFDFVWRSLLLLDVPANAVEDAVQEVFSVVSRQLDTFEGRSSVRTWLFAILQRVAANQRRTVRRKQQALEPLGDDPACRLPTPHARLEATESIQLVQRFCDSLDPERRAVFVLALLEELPAPEVSQVLGIPLNTVYSRVRALRDGLRRMLADEEASHG